MTGEHLTILILIVAAAVIFADNLALSDQNVGLHVERDEAVRKLDACSRELERRS